MDDSSQRDAMTTATEPSQGAQPAEPSGEGGREYLLLIHGTFSFSDELEGTRFYQRGSRFRRIVEEKCPQLEVADGPLTPPEGAVEFDPLLARFRWSGDNSEAAREAAARHLYERVQQFEAAGRPYHLLGHSHGGSIIWKVLEHASRAETDSSKVCLPNLKSATTVGTPFLTFRPDASVLWQIIPLVIILACSFWPGSLMTGRDLFGWLGDFWTQQYGGWSRSLTIALYWSALIAFGIGVVSLLLNLSWLWMRRQQILQLCRQYRHAAVDLQPALRDNATRFWAAAANFAICAVGLLAIHPFPNLSPQPLPGSESLPAMQLLVAIFQIVLVAYGLTLLANLWSYFAALRKQTGAQARRAETWRRFADRTQVLGLTYDDEAITLHRILESGFTARFLPRANDRDRDDLTAKGWIRRPEWALGRTNVVDVLSRAIGVVFAIVRRWVIAPFYNTVVAELIDRFIVDQLSRKLSGSDVRGTVFASVADHPAPRNANGQTARISTRSATAVRRVALSTLQKTGQTLRTNLLLRADRHLFLEALLSDASPSSAFVHNSYLGNRRFIRSVCTVLRGGDLGAELDQIDVHQMDATVPRVELRTGTVGDLVAMGARFVVSMLVVSAPAIVLVAIGSYLLFPTSRDKHVADALAPRLARLEAAREFGASPSVPSNVARWAVCSELRSADVSESLANQLGSDLARAMFSLRVSRHYLQMGDLKKASARFIEGVGQVLKTPGSESGRGALLQSVRASFSTELAQAAFVEARDAAKGFRFVLSDDEFAALLRTAIPDGLVRQAFIMRVGQDIHEIRYMNRLYSLSAPIRGRQSRTAVDAVPVPTGNSALPSFWSLVSLDGRTVHVPSYWLVLSYFAENYRGDQGAIVALRTMQLPDIDLHDRFTAIATRLAGSILLAKNFDQEQQLCQETYEAAEALLASPYQNGDESGQGVSERHIFARLANWLPNAEQRRRARSRLWESSQFGWPDPGQAALATQYLGVALAMDGEHVAARRQTGGWGTQLDLCVETAILMGDMLEHDDAQHGTGEIRRKLVALHLLDFQFEVHSGQR